MGHDAWPWQEKPSWLAAPSTTPAVRRPRRHRPVTRVVGITKSPRVGRRSPLHRGPANGATGGYFEPRKRLGAGSTVEGVTHAADAGRGGGVDRRQRGGRSDGRHGR